MPNIKEIEEKCYSEFAMFIFKNYYEEMLAQKRKENNQGNESYEKIEGT